MRRYALREAPHPDTLQELSTLPPLLSELLVARGITEPLGAQEFLNPSYEKHLHDPYLLPDMEKSVERILSAIAKSEKVVIWNDYDCDGIPGGALLHDFFKKINYANFRNYIPHRHREGYGLNVEGIETLKAEGAALIITVDCGIVDHVPIEKATQLGIDVIVTDHHLPGETLPPAYAVINVKRRDSTYPFDGLSGAGTAFKLVQALLIKNRFGIKEGWEKWLLDMAGLATIADMMPLIGENRALAHYGLKVLRKSPRPGLMKLCRLMKTEQSSITEDDVGFMIAPRVNAASRMDKPEDAFHLLTTTDEGQADELAAKLNRINDERKGVVASTVKEIKKRIASFTEVKEVIVMGNPAWRPGLLGLAANTLVEEYSRPVFLWGREGGEIIKGSCRSDGSVNVVTLMGAAKRVFDDFGGHSLSGGFSMSQEKVHVLEETLIAAYKEVRLEEGIIEEAMIDKKLSLEDVTFDTYRLIEKLSPFGEGNPKPLFMFEDVEVKEVRMFGKEKQHLELLFENFSGRKISAIAFFAKPEDFQRVPVAGKTINLVANMEKSNFRNYSQLRLRIIDIV